MHMEKVHIFSLNATISLHIETLCICIHICNYVSVYAIRIKVLYTYKFSRYVDFKVARNPPFLWFSFQEFPALKFFADFIHFFLSCMFAHVCLIYKSYPQIYHNPLLWLYRRISIVWLSLGLASTSQWLLFSWPYIITIAR